MITNKYNLPDAIVKAIENDDYTKGNADYSVTGLLKPGYMNSLYQQHKGEIIEDASDRIYSLMGKLMHLLFERAGDTVETEKRLYANIYGAKISGQIDVLNGSTIQDYKFVTVYKAKDTDEYEKQLNMYRYLCLMNGIETDKLEVVLIFRDWSKMKAQRESNYPQSQVIVKSLPIWDDITTYTFISERIKAQKDATPCTDAERWSKGGNFAIMQKGKTRAVRLFDTEIECQKYIDSHELEKCTIEYRRPEYVRCENYCNVKEFCQYYKDGQK
jgi:hypothetical protein